VIEFKVVNLAEATDIFEQARLRILVGIRLGIRDAIKQLHEAAVANGEGIAPQWVLDALTDSIYETDEYIVGNVAPRGSARGGLAWSEKGTRVPAYRVPSKYMQELAAMVASAKKAGEPMSSRWRRMKTTRKNVLILDPHHSGYGEEFFTSHRAFSVSARPFMQRTQDEAQEQIVATIKSRIAEAMQA
jgi:phage gpG-like protein